MTYTNVDAANQALALVGANAITAIDTTTPEGTEVGRFYDELEHALLVKRPWRFAMKTAELTAATAPDRGWSYAHDLPADMITGGWFALFPDDGDHRAPVKQYQIFGKTVRSHRATLWADYVYEIAEDDWPGDFRRLFYTALAAEICWPLTEQRELTESLRRRAWGPPSENGNGGLWATAALADSMRSPTRALTESTGPLTGARLGRGGSGGWIY
jgi:hypothetical protein